MANYYCEFCGKKYSNIQTLSVSSCARHPNGANKGKHKLYEGSEKAQYSCKYCGIKNASLENLKVSFCVRHPLGANKGKHAPAL